MKRIVLLPLLLLLISAWLPFHSVNANEHNAIANGVYQVELSFLSQEIADADVLFSKRATLTVKEGRCTLSIPAINDYILTKASAVQQGNKTNTWLDRVENLVQFDIKDVQGKVELTGSFKAANENVQRTFSIELLIQKHSLPKFQPIQAKPVIQQADDTIHYKLQSDGRASGMNDYVNPVMRIIERDNRFYAHMEILQPDLVTGLTVEQQGNLIKPEVVIDSQTRIVQFEVEDFQKGTRIWMKAGTPGTSNMQDELIQIVFNQKQAAKFVGRKQPVVASDNGAVSSLTKRVEQPPKPANETTVIEKDIKEEVKSEASDRNAVAVPPVLTEEKLEFDRSVDAKKEPEPDSVQVAGQSATEMAISEPDGQVIPFDVWKIGILFSLCILSGILLIRRLTKKNKTVTSE